MYVIFNRNKCTTIVSFYSPTNVNGKIDIITFFDALSSFARNISRRSVLIIGGVINSQFSKDWNNKFGSHNLPNKNGEYLIYLSHDNSHSCQNTKFQKREVKQWSYSDPNNPKL